MKKVLSVLLIVAMMLGGSTVAFAAPSGVLEFVSDVPALVRPGEEFTVTIGVDGVKEHVVSGDFEVFFDTDKLELISATGVGKNEDDAHLAKHFASVVTSQNNCIFVSLFSYDTCPEDYLEIVRLKLKATGSGSCNIRIDMNSWSDAYQKETVGNGSAELRNNEYTVKITDHYPVAIPDVAPTCSTPGKKGGMKCSECGKVLAEPTEIPALDHMPGVFQIIPDPADGENWIKVSNCMGCGTETSREDIPDDVAADGKTLGYLGDVNLDKKVNAIDARIILRCSASLEQIDASVRHLADIDADGKIVAVDARIALRMSANLETLFVYGVPYHAHKYESNVIVNSTCEQEGEMVDTCSICGFKKLTKIPVSAHSFSPATCINPKTCTVCGKTEGKTVAHKFSNATCSTPKKCSVCGKTEGGTVAHKYSKATCYEPATCSVCRATSGSPAGHKFVNGKCSCGLTLQKILSVSKELTTATEVYLMAADMGTDALKSRDYTTYLKTVYASFIGDGGLYASTIEMCGNIEEFAVVKSNLQKATNSVTSKFNSLRGSNGKVLANSTNAYKMVAVETEAMKSIKAALTEMQRICEKYSVS